MNIRMQADLVDFKIVDFHLHLPIAQDDWLRPYREEYVKNFGQERWDILAEQGKKSMEAWLPEFCFPTPEAPSEDYFAVGERWYREALSYDLEKVVFVTGGTNEILAQVVAKHPDKFAGFAHHYIEDEGAADKLEKAISQQGLKGYKILGPVVKTPLDDRRFDDVWEVAYSHEIPVLVHFGILGGGGGIVSGHNVNPLAIAEVAKRFPKIRFIVPHFGCGYTKELLHLCWASRNVYIDTSGNNLWAKWMPETLTLEGLFRKFYETIGPERIIFGTDSEWFPRGFAVRYLLDQLRACRSLNMPEPHIRCIFRENALGLL